MGKGLLTGCLAGCVAHSPLLSVCLGCSCGGGMSIMGSTKHYHMLLCDVFLGRTKTLRRSKQVDPAKDLAAGVLGKAFNFGDYNSVLAPGGLFGAVHVPEWIIYEPFQAIPRYAIEFEWVPYM